MHKLVFLASLFFVSIAFAQSGEDSLTITTYYPAPYGVYHELHSDGMSIGSANRTQAPPTDGLIVQGNVGIGTTTVGAYGGKQTSLEVNGYTALNDVYLKDVNRWASKLNCRVTKQITYNVPPNGTAEALCNSNEIAMSGGCSFRPPGDGQDYYTYDAPKADSSNNPIGWQCGADSSFNESAITVYAICCS